ncbi:MAG TPA: hypothetical protein VGL05_04780 [Kribbella sp.]
MQVAAKVELVFYGFDNPAEEAGLLAQRTVNRGWNLGVNTGDEQGPWVRVTLPQEQLIVNLGHLVGVLALAEDTTPDKVLSSIRRQVDDLGYDLRRRPRR